MEKKLYSVYILSIYYVAESDLFFGSINLPVVSLYLRARLVSHLDRGQFSSLASCNDNPRNAHSDSAARVRKYSELTRAR